MVDDAYKKINKAMFESLKVIAKESPAVMATQGQGDPEDKEALNYHILLIENMNHYIEEVDDRSDMALLEWKSKAQDEMREHMGLYVDAVIRRPLGKLLVCSTRINICIVHETDNNVGLHRIDRNTSQPARWQCISDFSAIIALTSCLQETDAFLRRQRDSQGH